MTDHKEEALNYVQPWSGSKDSDIGRAQVHATLYLAEQQRIANLIAVWRADESELGALAAGGVAFPGLLKQIVEATK